MNSNHFMRNFIKEVTEYLSNNQMYSSSEVHSRVMDICAKYKEADIIQKEALDPSYVMFIKFIDAIFLTNIADEFNLKLADDIPYYLNKEVILTSTLHSICDIGKVILDEIEPSSSSCFEDAIDTALHGFAKPTAKYLKNAILNANKDFYENFTNFKCDYINCYSIGCGDNKSTINEFAKRVNTFRNSMRPKKFTAKNNDISIDGCYCINGTKCYSIDTHFSGDDKMNIVSVFYERIFSDSDNEYQLHFAANSIALDLRNELYSNLINEINTLYENNELVFKVPKVYMFICAITSAICNVPFDNFKTIKIRLKDLRWSDFPKSDVSLYIPDFTTGCRKVYLQYYNFKHDNVGPEYYTQYDKENNIMYIYKK